MELVCLLVSTAALITYLVIARRIMKRLDAIARDIQRSAPNAADPASRFRTLDDR